MTVGDMSQNLSRNTRVWKSWVQLSQKWYSHPLQFLRKESEMISKWRGRHSQQKPDTRVKANFSSCSWTLMNSGVTSDNCPAYSHSDMDLFQSLVLKLFSLYFFTPELYSSLLLLRRITEILNLRTKKLSILLS